MIKALKKHAAVALLGAIGLCGSALAAGGWGGGARAGGGAAPPRGSR